MRPGGILPYASQCGCPTSPRTREVVAADEAKARALGAEEILSIIPPGLTPTSAMPIELGKALCVHSGLRKPEVGSTTVGGKVSVDEEDTVPLHRVLSAL
jgi:hypothetical protein